jgi:hypothetical protein
MDIEFLTGLSPHLRPPELLTLLVCQHLERQDCYLADIASATGQSDVSARRCLRKLQKLGHLIYTVHNRGSDDPNYEVLWVRRGLTERTPRQDNLVRSVKSIKVCHPNHGVKTIQHGRIRRFMDEQGLNYRAFRSVINGARSHHHGWRLA